jgi:rRNA maturation RNase YbeY
VVKQLSIFVENKYKINKRLIHTVIAELREDLAFSVESLNINFVSSETIEKINIEHLGHHYSTDIITFNYSGSAVELDGELFISVEDARENSKRFKCSLSEELLRLIIHGILHLMGYDDMTPEDRRKMKRLENKLTIQQKHNLKTAVLIYDGKNC